MARDGSVRIKSPDSQSSGPSLLRHCKQFGLLLGFPFLYIFDIQNHLNHDLTFRKFSMMRLGTIIMSHTVWASGVFHPRMKLTGWGYHFHSQKCCFEFARLLSPQWALVVIGKRIFRRWKSDKNVTKLQLLHINGWILYDFYFWWAFIWKECKEYSAKCVLLLLSLAKLKGRT